MSTGAHLPGGAVDGDGAGQQMRAGAAVADAVENVGDARVHQQVGCIAGVVGQAFDGDQVSGSDGENRFEARVEQPQCTVDGLAGSLWTSEIERLSTIGRSCQPVAMASP